ncbi:MAG: lipase family protein [Hyphomicrobium sp.]
MAAAYAPDLKIVGVAAAAPATELGKLMHDDIDTAGGKNLLAMTLYAWSKVFDAPIQDVVTPTAMKTVDTLANVCLESIVDMPARLMAGQALMKDFLSVNDITDLQPWTGLMTQNTVGTLPPDLPVMLVQGTKDDTVLPEVTASYMAKLCAAGSKVTMHPLPGIGHLSVAKDGAPAFVEWLGNVAAGRPVANNCTSG